jgi:RNA polymerase sigma factor (sigma-70 family)
MKDAISKYQKTSKLEATAPQSPPMDDDFDVTDDDFKMPENQLNPAHRAKKGIPQGNSLSGSRDEIIKEYAPLIKYIAQKIAARLPANIELDDLISAGVIGLMDAIEKYDPTRDNKFKTYAEFRIRGAILDELRSQDWVPRSVRDKAKKIERAYAELEEIESTRMTILRDGLMKFSQTNKDFLVEKKQNLLPISPKFSAVGSISSQAST